MRAVYGVGDSKLRDFGNRFLAAIAEHGRSLYDGNAPAPAEGVPTAFDLYRQGRSIEEVMRRLDLKRGAAVDALLDFIRRDRPASLDAWVDPGVRQRVLAAARVTGSDRAEPLFRFLGEEIAPEDVRLVLAHVQAVGRK
jgi:hypothetical protein